MKSVVIYFSQTGNTKKAAEAIQGGIRSAAGHCDLLRVQDAEVGNLSGYDLIGVGGPVFVFKPSVNLNIFMSRLSPLKGKPCFIFATHGGHPGNFMPAARRILERQGLEVIGAFDCDGEVTRPSYPYPFWTGGTRIKSICRWPQALGKKSWNATREYLVARAFLGPILNGSKILFIIEA